MQWLRVTVDEVALKEEKVFVTSGEKTRSVRKKTNVVFGMRVTIVQDQHQHHFLSQQLQEHEVRMRQEKETPEAEASLGSSIDSRVSTSCKVLDLNHFVSIGIFRNVNLESLNRDVISAHSAYSFIGRLKSHRTKSR